MKRLPFIAATALLIGAVGSGPAQAMECFGGFTCEEIGAAAFSFKTVRDCPADFQIRPDKKAKFDRAMNALLNRPMAKVTGNEEFSTKPNYHPADVCDRAARKFMDGSSSVEFLGVKSDAMRRLKAGRK
ncbi:hypothetical protein [Labrys miyagiensis]|nr:hypothetical protein [Labrys miyagiensis]